MPSEIRKDLGNVKAEVNQMMRNLQEFSQSSRQEIQDLKSIVERTYDLVVDTRYKVIQMINVLPFQDDFFSPTQKSSQYTAVGF